MKIRRMSKNKDWIGNKNSIYKTLGATNHTDKEREENDFYATDSIAIDKLEKVFRLPQNIYECACGQGDLSKRLKELNHNVYSTDLINRGYGDDFCINFLELEEMPKGCEEYSVLTNPPYKFAKEFILKGLELVKHENYVIMFLKVQFLEGKERFKSLFDKYNPKYIFVSSERILCAKNADFQGMKESGCSAVAYAWFIWQKGYKGETILKWM